MIDLHTHTTTSDGADTPAELVANAVRAGVTILAVTDHDTIEGIAEAQAEADRINTAAGKTLIRVIPGVEFSTRYKGRDVHVLGYFVPTDDIFLLGKLDEQNYIRMARDLKMIRKMNEAGIPVTMEDLTGGRLNTTITRANYGQYLFDHGYASSVADAFDRLIGRGCPFYVSKEHMSPIDAVRTITAAGAVAFFAHPGLSKLSEDELTELIADMVAEGLQGIEVYHSDHTPEMTQTAKRLADRFGLQISRGSDYHGRTKPKIRLGTGHGALPDCALPPVLSERLKASCSSL